MTEALISPVAQVIPGLCGKVVPSPMVASTCIFWHDKVAEQKPPEWSSLTRIGSLDLSSPSASSVGRVGQRSPPRDVAEETDFRS